MKNSVIIALSLFVLALMSFTSEFDTQKNFNEDSALLDTVKGIDSLVVDLVAKDTVRLSSVFYQEDAHASYYADKFTGRRTASGAVFNNNELTCAHKTLPFGTKLRVTSPKTGKSVDVKVTDRGPFSKGRHIDLSKKAFMKIAPNTYGGHIKVNIEIIKE